MWLEVFDAVSGVVACFALIVFLMLAIGFESPRCGLGESFVAEADPVQGAESAVTQTEELMGAGSRVDA